jgi:hypothetical protein
MMYKNLTFILSLLAFSACAEEEPPLMCTQMGCVDGLQVAVDPNYRWQPGDYIFEIAMDGKPQRCEGALPLRSCDLSNLSCTGEGATVMESGCALPKDAHGFGDIHFSTTPKDVAVKIIRNGKTIGEGKWQPHYQKLAPNGEACGPICQHARVELELQ